MLVTLSLQLTLQWIDTNKILINIYFFRSYASHSNFFFLLSNNSIQLSKRLPVFPLLQVKNVFEQDGFSRQKRGYRNINDIEVNMSDPLFTKQWYLVSDAWLSLTFYAQPHSSTLIA